MEKMGKAFSERIFPLFRFPRNYGGRDRRINSVRDFKRFRKIK